MVSKTKSTEERRRNKDDGTRITGRRSKTKGRWNKYQSRNKDGMEIKDETGIEDSSKIEHGKKIEQRSKTEQ